MIGLGGMETYSGMSVREDVGLMSSLRQEQVDALVSQGADKILRHQQTLLEILRHYFITAK